MNKNDEIELLITDMGNEGEGIGRYEGMALFVKGAVKGDRILAGVTKLKKTYGYARLIKVLEPSSLRTEPLCPKASRCGGCQLQMMDYNAQLEYKATKVREVISRVGRVPYGSYEELPIIGAESIIRYRNKAQFPVGNDRDGKIVSGFYAGHTHSIIDTEDCIIEHEITGPVMAAVKEYMKETGTTAYDETSSSGVVRHVLTRVGFTTHEVMVCLVVNADSVVQLELLTQKVKAAVNDFSCSDKYELKSLSYNVNKEITNVIMGEQIKVIYGDEYITDYIGSVKYRISPLSFYQVNPEQTNRLYNTALEFAGLTGNETVWDLYCGIGTISLFLAQQAKKVYGVEIVAPAIADARENAKLNNITNVEFYVGASEDILPQKYAEDPSMKAEVIVVDPPRKGCDASLLDCIAKVAPDRIVYVSCDPATLARDVAILTDKGYEVKKVRAVDMFPMTGHVETVCLLSRIK